MSDEAPGFDGNILKRAARLVVPWIVLGIIVLVVYTLLSDYRQGREAKPEKETTGTVDTTGAAAPGGSSYVIVLTDGLSMRDAAAPDAVVLKNLTVNDRLAVLDRAPGWYKVKDASGAEGWVAAGERYTRLVEE